MPYDNLYREGWVQFNVRLKKEDKIRLEKLAQERGVSQVALMRALVVKHLNDADQTTKDK